jgi:hypothetical protein
VPFKRLGASLDLFDNPVGCLTRLAVFRLAVAKLQFLAEVGAETEVSK